MNTYNVLIFPGGTEIGFEINNALKYTKFLNVYGGSSMDDHAEFVYKNYIPNLPFVTDDNLICELNRVTEKYNIDFIYPAHDSVVLKLTQHKGELKAKVVTSDLNTVSICRSKAQTYDYLKDEDFIPKTFSCAAEVKQYPVFIKPSVGQGSVGAKVINSEEELNRELNDGSMVICEYLPGDEYTVDCFTDKKGKLRACILRNRERIRTGISVRSKRLTEDESVLKIAQRLNEKFNFNGAWFFQLKRNVSGEFRLLEVSPRIPGTMGLSRNAGINFPLLTIYNMLGYDVSVIDNKLNLIVDRSFISRYKYQLKYDSVYIDFDDTIIVKDKVNLTAIMFLYQLKNNNKHIFLLTKHNKNIMQSLDKYKISRDLFDEIIHIKPDENKSMYIKNKSAIFIDDSFAERMNVKKQLDIPVFDLDMIESLLDWRV